MAAKFHEAGYSKHFGDRLANVSDDTTEKEIAQVYEGWANQYDKQIVQSARCVVYQPISEYFSESIQRVFQDKPKDGLKIIDAGAGTGLIGMELHKLGYTNLHALDISQEMLSEAKKKNVYNKFICASLSDQRIAEIDTGEYDALICVGTLVKGHVRSSAFVEMVRMVKTDGLLCFNIRDSELDDYQGKMLELEKEGRWENVSKKTMPLYASDGMPKEVFGYIYRVLRN